MIRSGVHFPGRRQFIHDLWQVFSQELRGKIGVHSHFSCDRTNLIGTKRFLNLVGRNRLVFTHANP